MKKAKIEVFRAGKYGESSARNWTDEEIKQLVENYDASYRNAPIILGHNDWAVEKPAYGWVEGLSLNENGVVLAEIEYNDALEGMVQNKMYTRVSIEATKSIENSDSDTTKQGAYMLAVALLGGTQPAVSGLQPVQFSAEDKENTESFENEITAFESDATINSENDDKTTTDEDVEISDTIVVEVEDVSTENKTEEQDLTKEELEKLNADKEAFKLEQEQSRTEQEAFKKEKEEFSLAKKTADVELFMEENSKRIVPVSADNVKEFMLSLTDELLASFKEIVGAMPENDVFDRMDNTNTNDEEENLDTDEQFRLQAEKDIAKANKKK